ncbi:hypothetical protein EGW08_000992 [Elysia chlorotica]|uniref:Hexosyltransferase n=1 Tax=Elysia chlorotica TaxID=188477 RepID=A0A3S1CFH0_ELYCH|nr:hypothetical protein EGW08_000992 [Elysia chlorotica]
MSLYTRSKAFFQRLLWMFSHIVPSTCTSMTVFVCLVFCVVGFVTINMTVTPLERKFRLIGNLSNDSVSHHSTAKPLVPLDTAISSNHSISVVLGKAPARLNASVASNHSKSADEKDLFTQPMTSENSSNFSQLSMTTARNDSSPKAIPSQNSSNVSKPSGGSAIVNNKTSPQAAAIFGGNVLKGVVIPKTIPAVKNPDVKPGKVQVTSMSKKLLEKGFFRDVILPSTSCKGRNIELLICVPVKRDSFAVREVIRLTWGSYAWTSGRLGLNTTTSGERPVGEIMIVFFVGSSSLESSKAEQDSLIKEAKIYGDIYQADFIDTYENLTLKSISILNFVSLHCPNARYVAKIDEDIYVNVPVLLKELNLETKKLAAVESNSLVSSLNIPQFVYGYLFRRAVAIRNKKNKWYTSLEDYKPKFYPNYLSGTAYVMSGTAALSLYEATLKVPIFWMEDIYVTGMCAAFARIPLISNQKLFSPFKRTNISGCTFKNVISSHSHIPSEFITIQAQLNSPFLKC